MLLGVVECCVIDDCVAIFSSHIHLFGLIFIDIAGQCLFSDAYDIAVVFYLCSYFVNICNIYYVPVQTQGLYRRIIFADSI